MATSYGPASRFQLKNQCGFRQTVDNEALLLSVEQRSGCLRSKTTRGERAHGGRWSERVRGWINSTRALCECDLGDAVPVPRAVMHLTRVKWSLPAHLERYERRYSRSERERSHQSHGSSLPHRRSCPWLARHPASADGPARYQRDSAVS